MIPWKLKAILRRSLPPMILLLVRKIINIPRSAKLGLESLKIRFADRETPPILIYVMRKVGSTSVQRSLQASLANVEIYKTHNLSKVGIEEAESYYGAWQPITLRISKMLHNHIDRIRAARWRLITLVRDPIAREISDLFQDISNIYPDLIDGNGDIKSNAVLSFLEKRFREYDPENDYACTWFDKEFKQVFGVDVYSYPFDQQAGFVIINEENLSLLILRLEDLNRNFQSAVEKFLDRSDPVSLPQANVGMDKPYSSAYDHVIVNIALPESVCEKVYSSKYARHFYSQPMRAELTRKWSRN